MTHVKKKLTTSIDRDRPMSAGACRGGNTPHNCGGARGQGGPGPGPGEEKKRGKKGEKKEKKSGKKEKKAGGKEKRKENGKKRGKIKKKEILTVPGSKMFQSYFPPHIGPLSSCILCLLRTKGPRVPKSKIM